MNVESARAERLRSEAAASDGMRRTELYRRRSIRRRSWWSRDGLERRAEIAEQGFALRGERADGTGCFLSASEFTEGDLDRWRATRFVTVGAWPESPPPAPGALRWTPVRTDPAAEDAGPADVAHGTIEALTRRGFSDVELEFETAERQESWHWGDFGAEREATIGTARLQAGHPILGDWVAELQNVEIDRLPDPIDGWREPVPSLWVVPPARWRELGLDPLTVRDAGAGLWVDPRGTLGIGFDDAGRPVPDRRSVAGAVVPPLWIRGSFDDPPAPVVVGIRIESSGATERPAAPRDFLVERVRGVGGARVVGGWVRECGARIAWAETAAERPVIGECVGTEGAPRHGAFGCFAPRALVRVRDGSRSRQASSGAA